MYDIQQSTSGTDLTFLMVLASDHVSPATGLSPTVTLRKNQGAFGSPIGTVSEIASGWYKVAGTGLTTDTNTLGPLILHATGGAADVTDFVFNVVAYDPRDVIRLGLTAFPNIASGNAGALPTVGTGTAQISVANGQVILQTGTGAGQLDFTSGIIKSNISQVTGQAVSSSIAQLGVNIVNIGGSASLGAAGYVGIDWSKVSTPGSTVALTGTTIGIVSSIGTSGITSTSFASPNVTGVATNFIDKADQVWRRFFKKTDRTATDIHSYADNGSTIITTQAYTSVSGTETVGTAS